MLIAFHDDRLDRVTDRTGVVARMSWADVRPALVMGTEPILQFDELLEALPDARFNVEPKHDAAVGPLIAIVKRMRALDRICVGSFSDRRLAIVREAFGSAICTSLGTGEVAALRAAAWGLPAFGAMLRRRPGMCVQVPTHAYGVQIVTARLVASAHQLRLPVHVWTVNGANEMGRLLDLGVDGLMTDRPKVLRDVLRGRQQWPPTSTR